MLDESYSVPKVAERLVISSKNLYHWKQQHKEGRLVAGVKRAKPTTEEAELRRHKLIMPISSLSSLASKRSWCIKLRLQPEKRPEPLSLNTSISLTTVFVYTAQSVL